jgi:cytochrome b561
MNSPRSNSPDLQAVQRYGTVAALLHWVIAVLIVTNFVIGWTFPHHVAPGQRFSPKPLLPLHMSIGLLVMLLSIARLAWRLHQAPPPLPAYMPAWERLLARCGHLAFYVLMIAMPFTGWLAISAHKVQKTELSLFNIIPWPHFPVFPLLAEGTVVRLHDLLVNVHRLLALWLLPAILALHVGAVLKHHLLDRDPILRRMLPY